MEQQQQQQHYSIIGAGSNKNINHYSQTLTYLLGELKHVYDQRDDAEKKRKAAFERLAEISKIMRIIIEKYSLLESKELLLNASQLVKAVKQYDYNNYSFELHSNLIDLINALYKSFQYNISNCLMQDGFSMSSTKSLELSSSSTTQQQQQQISTIHNQNNQNNNPNRSRTLPIHIVEKNTNLISSSQSSYEYDLDELLKQAKYCCKYMKELVSYIEKRSQIENEYNRSIVKNNQNLLTIIQQMKNDKASFIPFNNVYNEFCQCEIKNLLKCDKNYDMLLKEIIQPIINELRFEFEKELKKIKDEWYKCQKQLNDTIQTYSKSRENFYQQKIQDAEMKTNKKFSYHESSNEYNEVDAQNTRNLWYTNEQREFYKKSKRDLINRLQILMGKCECKLKELTVHYFETLDDSIKYSPKEIELLIKNIKKYEMGKHYHGNFSDNHQIIDDTTAANSNTSHYYNQNNNQYNNYMQQLHFQQQQQQNSDSSESENGVIVNNKQQKQKFKNLKINENSFQAKSIEKKYKSVHQYKKGVKCNDNNKCSTTTSNILFGVPLCQLSKCAVPDIIKQCVNQIEQRGSRQSGIYRTSAVKSQLDSLVKTYETNPPNGVDLSNVAPNLIANLLKQFFRMLPEPLLTFQLYNELIEVATIYSKNSQIDSFAEEDIVNRLKKICRCLPTVHNNTLRYLINHLKQISNDAEFNQMTPGNLGIVFGPTLLKKADNDDTNMLYDTNHQSRVIELFILYADRIFDTAAAVDINDNFNKNNANGLHRNNSFGHIDGNKTDLLTVKQNGENMNNNNGYGNKLLKSATCSSIRPDTVSQMKHDMNQARCEFFSISPQQKLFSSQQSSSSSSYSPPKILESNTQTSPHKSFTVIANKIHDSTLSPFSQITATSKIAVGPLNRHVSSLHQQHHQQQKNVKRIVSDYQSISKKTGSQQQLPLEKSSSHKSIYNKNNELSKSSSDIYQYKNIDFSINSSEDHV